MSFRDLIEGMHRKNPGIRGGALAGGDGLPVEEWQVSPQTLDISALCAEMAQFFKESGRIACENGLGSAREVCVAGDEGSILAARVNEDYIILLVADPSAVPGKCRFQLLQAARRAKEML
ncbi:MAG: roadblock/LC7 domain-containing protein [Deltaproteobacteria bacterium]|nr:roadblock/LC7 domain-containing protein [Deltaproteobacteria bacterium]